ADFSGDGNLIALSGGDRWVTVLSVPEDRVIARLKQNDGVTSLAFAADGRLAVAAGRTVRLRDASTGEPPHKCRSFRKFSRAPAVMSVSMTPGRTSYTRMPDSARRSANSCVTVARPAFETQ